MSHRHATPAPYADSEGADAAGGAGEQAAVAVLAAEQPLGDAQGQSWARRLVRPGLTVAVLGLCVLVFRQLDLEQVKAALRGASYPLVGLAMLINISINVLARSQRFAMLLSPLPRRSTPRLLELCSLLLASMAASNVLPARAGEAVRTVGLHRRHGYPVPALVAAQLLEQLVQGLSLSVLALGAALLWRPPAAVRLSLLIFGIGVPVSAAVLGILSRRYGRRPWEVAEVPAGARPWRRWLASAQRFGGGLAETLHLLHEPRVFFGAFYWSLLSDLIDALMLGLCLHAVGLHLSPGAWLSALVVLNLAIVVPSTPGQMGTLEAGAVLVLRAMGAPAGPAMAFALLYHISHLVPLTPIGLIELRRRWLVRSR